MLERVPSSAMPGDVDGMPWDDLPAWVAGVQGSRPPADLTAYEARLPVQCELLGLPVGSIEDAFTAATGPNMSEINWDGLCSPDAPDVAARAGFLAPVTRAAGWWSPSAATCSLRGCERDRGDEVAVTVRPSSIQGVHTGGQVPDHKDVTACMQPANSRCLSTI
ncbi:hypothetical protein [Streptomyces flaveolus]|uniref:hypothetical protein n=1 Tax=Streptomyces flaveolus TaxID=67297 RepID=UPI00380B1922